MGLLQFSFAATSTMCCITESLDGFVDQNINLGILCAKSLESYNMILYIIIYIMYLMKNASVNTCIKCITFQENTSGILMKNICHNSLCRMHTYVFRFVCVHVWVCVCDRERERFTSFSPWNKICQQPIFYNLPLLISTLHCTHYKKKKKKKKVEEGRSCLWSQNQPPSESSVLVLQ